MNSLQSVLENVKQKPNLRIAVAVAEDADVLRAVKEACDLGVAHFLLFGDESRMKAITDREHISLSSGVVIRHIRDVKEACRQAVMSVHSGEADIVMKGLVDTSLLLKAVLDREYGLRDQGILSHVAVFEVPGEERLWLVTDAALHISPTLDEKVEIIKNAAAVARSLNIDIPRVAPIAAIEKVNPDMPATVDAALLSKMAERGQIPGVEVDGPLALDNAISPQAAEHKGIKSRVAGKADILLLPDIESGNVLYKSLTIVAGARVGGIVVGGRAPVIVTSRADTHETKMYAIALAVMTAYRSYREMKPLVHL